MYPQAQRELSRLLSSKLYPSLVTLPEYQKLLVKMMPNAQRCDAKAAEVAQNLRSSGGVHEFGTRQAVEAKLWTGEIFRAVGPHSNPYGAWWFDGELVRRWERNYAGLPRDEKRRKVLQSLRPMLAVCYDWNDFTDLWVMRPGPEGIPLLTGQGTAQPVFSKSSPQYDQKEKVVFIGGFQQMYVPFVPRGLSTLYTF
jgi:hypothetical protein